MDELTGFDQIKFGFSVLQWLIVLAVGVYTWIASRDAANAAEVVELSHRVGTLEEAMKHLPDGKTMTALHADMSSVKAQLSGIQRSLEPLGRSLDRINQYLLDHKP